MVDITDKKIVKGGRGFNTGNFDISTPPTQLGASGVDPSIRQKMAGANTNQGSSGIMGATTGSTEQSAMNAPDTTAKPGVVDNLIKGGQNLGILTESAGTSKPSLGVDNTLAGTTRDFSAAPGKTAQEMLGTPDLTSPIKNPEIFGKSELPTAEQKLGQLNPSTPEAPSNTFSNSFSLNPATGTQTISGGNAEGTSSYNVSYTPSGRQGGGSTEPGVMNRSMRDALSSNPTAKLGFSGPLNIQPESAENKAIREQEAATVAARRNAFDEWRANDKLNTLIEQRMAAGLPVKNLMGYAQERAKLKEEGRQADLTQESNKAKLGMEYEQKGIENAREKAKYLLELGKFDEAHEQNLRADAMAKAKQRVEEGNLSLRRGEQEAGMPKYSLDARIRSAQAQGQDATPDILEAIGGAGSEEEALALGQRYGVPPDQTKQYFQQSLKRK